MKALAAALLFLGASSLTARAQDASVPPERAAARAWFQDAKFGMFIHWGVYSLLGQGEWVMQNKSIPVEKYEWLAS
ncbi:MAG TPA: alpha-L-fucosidase, partial [Gemmatimonadaceae bacterium]|nr:alpha-L-fucosidase [Gemmatimonadaceae bacterium]